MAVLWELNPTQKRLLAAIANGARRQWCEGNELRALEAHDLVHSDQDGEYELTEKGKGAVAAMRRFGML